MECSCAEWGAVCRDLLDRGLSVKGRVKGWSMRPAICDGDVILVEPPAHASPRIGEIVMSLTAEGVVRVHRVVRVSRRADGRIVTKGDAVLLPDAPIPLGSVIGRVRRVERNGRSIRLDGPFWTIAGGLLARCWRLGPDVLWLFSAQ